MMTIQSWSRLAAAALLLVVLLGAFLWYLQPERGVAWAASILVLPAILGGVVVVKRARGCREFKAADRLLINRSLVGAGLILAISLGLSIATSFDLLGSNPEEVSQRVMGVVLGLTLVVMGNFVPKRLKPLTGTCEPARVQALQRFTGWVFVLAGLTYATLWLVLPVEQADVFSIGVVMAGLVLVVSRTAWVVRIGKVHP